MFGKLIAKLQFNALFKCPNTKKHQAVLRSRIILIKGTYTKMVRGVL